MTESTRRVFRPRSAGSLLRRPWVTAALHLVFLTTLGCVAYLGRGRFVRALGSADRDLRDWALVTLFLSVMVAAISLDRLREVFARWRRHRPETGVTLDDEKLTIADGRGQTAEFAWAELEEVLAFTREADSRMPNLFLLAGEQSEFVPAGLAHREELLAEILRRSGLVLTQEGPQLRRYGRGDPVGRPGPHASSAPPGPPT